MKIVVANHKMNLDFNDINEYIKQMDNYKDKFIVCPSSIYVPYFVNAGYKVGMQNIYMKNTGPYTGEVSPYQAKSVGVKYVMVGHSERRDSFNETMDIIKRKVKKTKENNLKVILCVGETLAERENGQTIDVIKKQLSVLDDENIIVSYEPIWAIGNNKVPTISDLKEVVNFIKKCYNVKVLYGGSVNEENIAELNEVKELDGFLIGGASIDPDKLIKILEVTMQ